SNLSSTKWLTGTRRQGKRRRRVLSICRCCKSSNRADFLPAYGKISVGSHKIKIGGRSWQGFGTLRSPRETQKRRSDFTSRGLAYKRSAKSTRRPPRAIT